MLSRTFRRAFVRADVRRVLNISKYVRQTKEKAVTEERWRLLS